MGKIMKAMKEEYKREKAIQDEKYAQRQEKQAGMSETEKAAKTANSIMKAGIWYYALPGLMILIAVAVFFFLWLWDMFVALF